MPKVRRRRSPKTTASPAFFSIAPWNPQLLFPLVIALVGLTFFFSKHALNILGITSASGPSLVTIQSGRLYVNGSRFDIKGVEYNPTSIGSDQLDATAPAADVPKMASLGINTIGVYISGKFDWDQWSNITTGEAFYNALYPLAESNNLKLIVAYFANNHVNWTDATQVSRLTSQYQDMVNKAKVRPSTLMYMIGNELFEKLSSDSQKQAYAQWAGQMVSWTHTNDPNHPVMYADPANQTGLSWLKQYAPSLDIYGVNNYNFTSAFSLDSIMASYAKSWPGKPILLHEWGSDSWDVATKTQDQTKQADRIKLLAQTISQVSSTSVQPFLGGLQFEYTDEYRFVGSLSTQDPDSGWTCPSCFDGKANEDFWGLASNASAGKASSRVLKPAYSALQSVWNTSTFPTPISSTTPTPTPTPSATPTPTPSTNSRPTISHLGIKDKTSTSVVITWQTNIPATSQVDFGPDSTNLANSTSIDTNLVTNHAISINSLSPNTKYFYRSRSSSNTGLESISSVKSFTTSN